MRQILMMLHPNYEVKIRWFCLSRVAPGWELSRAPVHTRNPKIVRAVQHWLYGGEALNVAVTFAASRVLYQQL